MGNTENYKFFNINLTLVPILYRHLVLADSTPISKIGRFGSNSEMSVIELVAELVECGTLLRC